MSKRRIVTASLSTAASVLGVGGATLGWGIARKLTAPIGPRDFDLTVGEIVQADGHQRLVLDRTQGTEAQGVYNLWFERGGWVQLGSEMNWPGSCSDRFPCQLVGDRSVSVSA